MSKFEDFIASGDSLRVYERGSLIFSSKRDRLLPLLDYIRWGSKMGATVYDKVVGNAAALLCIRAGAGEVYSPQGSREAARTLEEYAVKYRFSHVLPFIEKPGGGMCPMEKLSLGKTPEEFYESVKALLYREGVLH